MPPCGAFLFSVGQQVRTLGSIRGRRSRPTGGGAKRRRGGIAAVQSCRARQSCRRLPVIRLPANYRGAHLVPTRRLSELLYFACYCRIKSLDSCIHFFSKCRVPFSSRTKRERHIGGPDFQQCFEYLFSLAQILANFRGCCGTALLADCTLVNRDCEFGKTLSAAWDSTQGPL